MINKCKWVKFTIFSLSNCLSEITKNYDNQIIISERRRKSIIIEEDSEEELSPLKYMKSQILEE
jgi:hypothetical protein